MQLVGKDVKIAIVKMLSMVKDVIENNIMGAK